MKVILCLHMCTLGFHNSVTLLVIKREKNQYEVGTRNSSGSKLVHLFIYLYTVFI